MKVSLLVGLSCLSVVSLWAANTPEQSLKILKEGNERYVQGNMTDEIDLVKRRSKLVPGQEPIAVIVACSDSRVSPEILFNQSLGDLFVVRDAGNVIGPIEAESIQYAVQYLHAPLVVVMGHESCAAITAVLEGKAKEACIGEIASLIEPAIQESKKWNGNSLSNAVHANVDNGVKTLKSDPDFQKLIRKGRLQIIGAYYNLKTGQVEWNESPSTKTK